MRVAIVSDIHGNRQAFEAVLDEIDASDCEELWCLGDLVGYGAEPDACVELARGHAASAWPATTTSASAARSRSSDFSRGAALAATWTQETIAPETPRVPRDAGAAERSRRRSASTTPARATRSGSTCSRRCRPSCASTSRRRRVCLIGHSHVALSFWRARRGTGDRRDPRRRRGARPRGRRVADQPGQRRPAAATAIRARPGSSSTSSTGAPFYRRTEYDIAGAAAAIRAARLPDSLAERLAYGQ